MAAAADGKTVGDCTVVNGDNLASIGTFLKPDGKEDAVLIDATGMEAPHALGRLQAEVGRVLMVFFAESHRAMVEARHQKEDLVQLTAAGGVAYRCQDEPSDPDRTEGAIQYYSLLFAQTRKVVVVSTAANLAFFVYMACSSTVRIAIVNPRDLGSSKMLNEAVTAAFSRLDHPQPSAPSMATYGRWLNAFKAKSITQPLVLSPNCSIEARHRAMPRLASVRFIVIIDANKEVNWSLRGQHPPDFADMAFFVLWRDAAKAAPPITGTLAELIRQNAVAFVPCPASSGSVENAAFALTAMCTKEQCPAFYSSNNTYETFAQACNGLDRPTYFIRRGDAGVASVEGLVQRLQKLPLPLPEDGDDWPVLKSTSATGPAPTGSSSAGSSSGAAASSRKRSAPADSGSSASGALKSDDPDSDEASSTWKRTKTTQDGPGTTDSKGKQPMRRSDYEA